MSDLKKVGHWKGSYHLDADYPDAHDCVDLAWDPDERDAILGYLRSFPRRAKYRGFSRCRFCDKRNGSADYTDGVWVWPAGFPHYLQEHGVKPPQEFIDHALKADMNDDDDDDDWKPSAEEQAAHDRFFAIADRYPTFHLLMKIVHSRARIKKLGSLGAPPVILENEHQMLNKRLDELCAAMPYDGEVSTYPLPGIIEHFRAEFLRAPGKGDDA